MQRIPVVLITGFLGSGKTTLLNRLLRLDGSGKTAVVVNEFGEIGLDHELIAASDDNVILLANGCLCCAMRGDLVTALDKLMRAGQKDAAASFDRVAIETSGLANPSPVIQLLLGEPSLSARYRLAGVVTVVDAVNGNATLDAQLEAVQQVALAEHIMLTKTDLLGSGADHHVAALTARIHAINPAAVVTVDPRAIDALFAGAVEASNYDENWLHSAAYGRVLAAAGSDKTHDRRVGSFCWVREQPVSTSWLQLLVAALGENVGPRLLRIKGIVNVAEHPQGPAVINGAQQLLHEVEWLAAWPSAVRTSRIVFITVDTEQAWIEELLELIDRMAASAARARLRANQTAREE